MNMEKEKKNCRWFKNLVIFSQFTVEDSNSEKTVAEFLSRFG
jgi:hypothetical protein